MKRKPIVGETLYDLNVGNAARNHKQTLTPVIVRQVGSKYFLCSTDQFPSLTTQYELGTWKERTQYCANHRLYENEQEWQDERESHEIFSLLRKCFSDYSTPSLPLKTLRAIKTIAFSDSKTDLGWQDISTAPRDGREVILAVKLRAGIPGKMLVGHYMPGGHCIEDHPPIADGWYFWNGRMFDQAAEPTHWMPLPEPPKI